MSGMICYDTSGKQLEYLFQWDSGLDIVVKGIELDDNTLFYFSHNKSGCAIAVLPTVLDDGYKVYIPSEMTYNSGYFIIYASYKEITSDGRESYSTKYSYRVVVKPRKFTCDRIV